ncbi:MAG: hypothetical protein MUF54_23600 [Polyangiaceae bacterium]|jgi:hypothetical protein|nr:hypothetical protein [Polyangiaceae bacterium]
MELEPSSRRGKGPQGPAGRPARARQGATSLGTAGRAGAAIVSAAAIAVITAGCGASYQAIYEGEVRFEHCYRLDEEASAPPIQRRECWREWTQFYTYGQTRDRLEYALRRQRELTERIGNPGSAQTAPQPPAGFQQPSATHVAPAPTSAFAPPPIVQSTGPNAGATPPSAFVEMLSGSKKPPGQVCMLDCVKAWHACAATCKEGDSACRTTCDSAFSACVKGCVQ